MPSAKTPAEWATTPNNAVNEEDFFVEADGLDTSSEVFFMHHRLALRLETRDGLVHLFALSHEAQEKLLAQLKDEGHV